MPVFESIALSLAEIEMGLHRLDLQVIDTTGEASPVASGRLTNIML